MENSRNVITEGCFVIMQKGSYMRACKLISSRPQLIGKKKDGVKVCLKGAVGQCFGTTFRLVPSEDNDKSYALIKMTCEELTDSALQLECSSSGIDNRNLSDDGTSQKLTKQDIKELQNDGKSGKEVVQAITANSSTFTSKTKYSQEKYVVKKSKKYMEPVTLHRPTLDLVADVFYAQEPYKIANLRPDSLFQLLSQSNVSPGNVAAVFDSGTLSLVTAALLKKIGVTGRLVNVFPGQNAMSAALWTATNVMDFQEDELAAMSHISIHRLHTVDKPGKPGPGDVDPVNIEEILNSQSRTNGYKEETSENGENVTADQEKTDEKDNASAEEANTNSIRRTDNPNQQKRRYSRTRAEDERVSRAVLQCGVSSLVVAGRTHPLVPTMAMIPYLLPACPFVVYCPYKEPLMEVYQTLKAGAGTNLRLGETWFREYQVMPERTHPSVMMSGSGGYLLTGTKIRVSQDC